MMTARMTRRLPAVIAAACLAAGGPVWAAEPAPFLSLPPSILPTDTAPGSPEAALPSAGRPTIPVRTAHTGPAPSLSMQAAVDRAVRWHPLLQNARGQLLQVSEGIKTARSGYYPVVSGGVNAQTSNQNIGDTGRKNQQRAEIQLSQMLYDFGKGGSEVDQARAASGAARAQMLLSFDQVILNTLQAWIEVHRNEALVKVAQEQADVLTTLTQRVKERGEQGAGTSSDTSQAQARVEAAQVALLTAQSQVQLWRTTLMYWAGTAVPPQVTGTPAAVLDGACLAAEATYRADDSGAPLQSVSSVQMAQAQLEVAQAGLALADAQLRPTLSLSGSAGRRLGSTPDNGDARSLDASVMLNLSVPLYQGGRLQSGRQSASYGVESARAALNQARLNASQGWQSAVLEWRKFSGRIGLQAERQANMDATRVLYRDQYLQLGTRSLLDLLNAEQEYYTSLNDQIESQHEIYRQSAECLYYMGRLREAFQTDDIVARTTTLPDEVVTTDEARP